MDTATPDEQLMARIAQGDERALAALRSEYHAQLLAAAYRTLRNEALAEEVVQDVWLAVWTGADRFDAARGRFAAWVTTMTQRRAIDVVRSAEASRRRDDQWARLHLLAEVRDPSVDGEAAWVRRRIAVAMHELTPRQRAAVELVFLRGYSLTEAARIIGVGRSTAGSRLHDGLAGLRRRLRTDPSRDADELVGIAA